ncbi:MAG: hypothetical protein DSO07_00570 [Thermoproteota archaeon]|uniref:Uncharacterized protein n=1 Tax=Candidatus Methanodesulfokora washburnensis TaxID=2478471 RepID=A0A3R9QWP3_9CREN|nr:hypothetical protein [Candidatus Methanodesulfokores washburnensis]RSN75248.1 hypothetical protein D6D85_06350 [Candidatus Methanodesulfokores washburnensis]TDA42198.1 MAG: hypothetical protein DSO07_00570 [Candidatus Korarchaeota archaeon]
MYLVNSIGMGADLYAFLLLAGTNARVRDEGDRIIISGAPKIERKILSPLCCSVFLQLSPHDSPLSLGTSHENSSCFSLRSSNSPTIWIFKREKQKIS